MLAAHLGIRPRGEVKIANGSLMIKGEKSVQIKAE